MAVIYQFDDIVQIRCKGSYFGERFEIVQHFRHKSGGLLGSSWASFIRSGWLTVFRSQMVSTCLFDTITLKRLRPAPILREEIFPINPVVGAVTTQGMPHQIARLFRLHCRENGDQTAGRVYIPGVAMADFVGANWSNNAIASMNSTIAQFVAGWKIGGTSTREEWGVYVQSRDPPFWVGMVDMKYSSLPATMRSRRPNIV